MMNKTIKKFIEELIWLIIGILGFVVIAVFTLSICWFIIFPILKWLLNNGLGGIWDLIISISKSIWCGRGRC